VNANWCFANVLYNSQCHTPLCLGCIDMSLEKFDRGCKLFTFPHVEECKQITSHYNHFRAGLLDFISQQMVHWLNICTSWFQSLKRSLEQARMEVSQEDDKALDHTACRVSDPDFSHAQDKAWGESSFVTLGCHIYRILVMLSFWTHQTVTTGVVCCWVWEEWR